MAQSVLTNERWPYGYGVGCLGTYNNTLRKFFQAKPVGVGVESGFGPLAVEMGIGGLILWLIMSFAILGGRPGAR